MKRLFLLSILGLVLAYGLVRSLQVYLITKDDASIRVAITYHEKQYDLDLEPYSLLGDVLATLDLEDDVDYQRLNMNQVLKHQDQLVLPLIQDLACISLNTASLDDLMQLKGIGESTAVKILTYREEHGFFQSLEDLMDVKGIGKAKFAKIVDRLCL